MTNADRIRQMTDEELLAEIYRLQGIATACVACWEKKGRMMLEHYLKSEVKDEGEGIPTAG